MKRKSKKNACTYARGFSVFNGNPLFTPIPHINMDNKKELKEHFRPQENTLHKPHPLIRLQTTKKEQKRIHPLFISIHIMKSLSSSSSTTITNNACATKEILQNSWTSSNCSFTFPFTVTSSSSNTKKKNKTHTAIDTNTTQLETNNPITVRDNDDHTTTNDMVSLVVLADDVLIGETYQQQEEEQG